MFINLINNLYFRPSIILHFKNARRQYFLRRRGVLIKQTKLNSNLKDSIHYPQIGNASINSPIKKKPRFLRREKRAARNNLSK